MNLIYNQAINLLYHHVDIITTIIESEEFNTSPEFTTRNFKDNNDETRNRLVYSGYLKVVDPLTRSTILCLIDQASEITDNVLILGHNISEIRASKFDLSGEAVEASKVQSIIDADTEAKLANYPYFQHPTLSATEIESKRDKIVLWLKKNRIPVKALKDSNELVIADTAHIKAPYEHDRDYICSTRIIIKRLKRIIDSIQYTSEESPF